MAVQVFVSVPIERVFFVGTQHVAVSAQASQDKACLSHFDHFVLINVERVDKFFLVVSIDDNDWLNLSPVGNDVFPCDGLCPLGAGYLPELEE